MKLWRISNYATLSGAGGLKAPGRWHNKGIPAVYLADSPALAMLETLVHFDLSPDQVPVNYQLLEVHYEGRKGLSRLAPEALPDGWTEDEALTRSIGDQWLANLQGLLLKVPSALVPASFNYLVNPRHALAASLKVATITRHPYDPRLARGNHH